MGDVCTGTPTRTLFATSTSQAPGGVSTSTSQSVSVGQGTVVTRSVQSGTEWVFTESSEGGSTATVPVEVPVTVSGEQQVFTVPISTLFAPCTSESSTTSSTSTTPTSTATPTSTTPTSTPAEPTETPESRTSEASRTTRTSPTSTPPTSNAAPAPNTPTPTPSPAPQASSTSATGTLTSFSLGVPTTLPNGDQSTVIVYTTSSMAPSGGLNGAENGGNNGGGGGSNSTRAVSIGVGVAGGVIALIILIFGITWHIRRKRRNSMPLDDSEIWGTHHEPKTPPTGLTNLGPGYTYNPYSEVRPAAYAPVPTMSPPHARPIVLESDENRLSAGSYGPGAAVTTPLLSRAKTADQILYEAAREGLPKSRASSATASHHTRPSDGVRTNQSYTASHKTHGSMASRTSGSAVGLLDHPSASSTPSLNQDAHAAQRYQDLMDAPVELDRPMSPVSIAAPRLAIVNPDVDKDT